MTIFCFCHADVTVFCDVVSCPSCQHTKSRASGLVVPFLKFIRVEHLDHTSAATSNICISWTETTVLWWDDSFI